MPECTFDTSATPVNDMSSSIPLAYLSARKTSEVLPGRRFSSDQASNNSRQSPTLSANDQSLGEIEPDENVNDITQSNEFEEGGYGWVVTGCKLSSQYEPRQEKQT
jgi:hypothetical protein